MRTLIIRIVAVGLAGFLWACQGPSLAQRIDKGMQDFDAWPADVQEAVKAGRIEVGFTPEQVRMAWGKPDYETRETGRDGTAERWVWEKNTPAIGIGIGIGSSGRRGGVGGTVGTTVGGEHRVDRSVWFADGVVESFSE